MASFGWKRKVGEKVSKSTIQQFEAEAEGADDRAYKDDEVDWLHAIKRRREVLLGDCAHKSKRLKDEGALLAEQGRHWEAIKKWDEAIQLTPDNAVLYEMKSQLECSLESIASIDQSLVATCFERPMFAAGDFKDKPLSEAVLTILQEVFPAVEAAEMAVKLRPLWWEGFQTLGRAQLSLGEIDLAVRSFQLAIHLCPSELTLWQEDLAWAWKLQQQKQAAKEKSQQEEEIQKLILNAPELDQDYDFESDEVIAACTAVAERQKNYEELKKATVVLDTEGKIKII
ncbi:tetratricopeptide repeat protein 33 isoform X1 [Lampris incognitus]|uniref:tetratricopeptide repeat protein 33 isoform X1 n=1 Tax=Lampris incognitus TaxID=2546036 RepID=UPI0024B563F1|nr:tetratricopeptide repeat protein 33 isoform X1 [Lampris incognitus]